MKRVKSLRQVQRFLSIHDPIVNLFHLRRDSRPASDYRAARAQAFTAWVAIAGAPLAA
jgi:putative transposase